MKPINLSIRLIPHELLKVFALFLIDVSKPENKTSKLSGYLGDINSVIGLRRYKFDGI